MQVASSGKSGDLIYWIVQTEEGVEAEVHTPSQELKTTRGGWDLAETWVNQQIRKYEANGSLQER